jgi:hypothetical protein
MKERVEIVWRDIVLGFSCGFDGLFL